MPIKYNLVENNAIQCALGERVLAALACSLITGKLITRQMTNKLIFSMGTTLSVIRMKYLADGTNSRIIKVRKEKGFGIVDKICSMLDKIVFGPFHVETVLLCNNNLSYQRHSAKL